MMFWVMMMIIKMSKDDLQCVDDNGDGSNLHFTEGRLSDWREGSAGSVLEMFWPIRTFT